MSIDDLYNNFKIVKQDVKKYVGTSTGAQNMAFMTASSTSSTNDVNTANPTYEASTVSPNVNTASLQVSTANFSDIVVNGFEVAALSPKYEGKKVILKDGKEIFVNANDTAGNYETLKKQCDDLIVKLNQTDFTATTYKRGLATVEEQVGTYKKNEVLFSEEVVVLKRDVACKDYEINVLKSYGPRNSKLESNINHDQKSDNSKENFDDSFLKQQVSEDTSSFVESSLNVDKETTSSVDKNIEFVKPKNYDKPVRKSVRNYDPKGARFLIAACFPTPPLTFLKPKNSSVNFFSFIFILCMRTRSRSRSRNNSPQREASPAIVEPLHIELPFLEDRFQEDTPPDIPMADNRTMAELLQAPTEGYEDAIVIPEITATNFELKHGLINLVQNKQFFGHDKEDPHARRWLEKEPPRFILTWEYLVSKLINEFFPPPRTTNLRNENSNFQQHFDESFYEAWNHYKDLLRTCPHDGFTELYQLDTFCNALNLADQDSLNYAAGGHLSERRTQDVLTIIENKSMVRNSRNKSIVSQVKSSDVNSSSSSEIAKITHAVNQQTSDVTTTMTDILKQFQATLPLASVKAFDNRDAPEVDLGNILNSYEVPTTLHNRIHKDHPIENVIGEVQSSVHTRRMTKPTSKKFEPTSIAKALSNSSWVEAMQEEILQFKLQQVWILVDLPYGKKAIGTKWVFKNKKDERGIVIRNKVGFKDPDHPDKVYKVVKALYKLHQAPRAWYETLANYLLSNEFHKGKIDLTLFIK
nr:retrotransposon protein, putative, Ty1-copia subclass [Tanacetum cinerariifolium]